MELVKKHILFFSGISICTLALNNRIGFSVISGLDLAKKQNFQPDRKKIKSYFSISNPSPVIDNVISSRS